MDVDRIAKVIECAIDGHGDQKDLQGVPYRVHLEWVANKVSAFGVESIVVLAYLHDFIEDVAGAQEKIQFFPVTTDELGMIYLMSMPEIDRSLEYTKFYLDEYISKQIIDSGDARVMIVKMADTLHNSDPKRPVGETIRDVRRLRRYRASLKLLLPAYQASTGRIADARGYDFEAEIAERIISLEHQAELIEAAIKAKMHFIAPKTR